MMRVMYSKAAAKLNQHAGAALVVMAVFGGGLYAYQVNAVSEQNECQVELNRAVAANIKIRTQIAQRSDEAQTRLISGVGALFLLPPTEDKKEQARRSEEFLELFRKFDKTKGDVAVARAENPVPEIVGVCD